MRRSTTTKIGRQRRRRPILAALERLLWGFSLLCLGTVLWMRIDAWWFQSQASAHWREARRERALSPVSGTATMARQPSREGPGSSPNPSVETGETSRPPALGTPIAWLSIPRIDLALMVAEGTTDEVLQRAVGHLSNSAFPGHDGNVVLAGHRDTFFRPLEAIRIGDRIELDDGLRRTVYRVDSTEVVPPEATEVAAPSSEPWLTLITCYPFRYIGPAPERFVVRARKIAAAEADDASDPNNATDSTSPSASGRDQGEHFVGGETRGHPS